MDPETNNSEIGELIVGESPCTYGLVCEILRSSNSAGALWTKLLDISRSLEIPEDKVVLINPSLLIGTKTHSTVLFEILMAWRGKEGGNAKLNKLLNVLENLDLKDCADVLRQQFKPLENITLSMTWNDLSGFQKSQISNKLINFQGKSIKLGNFSQLEELDSSILFKLAKGENLEVVNNQEPKLPEYYIPRILKSRNKLKQELFKVGCNDIFVVQNITRDELSNLANENRTDVSTNQIRRLTVRFILLEYEPDYEKICKLSTSPIHWIKFENSSYKWIKSSGSIEILQKNVHEQQDTLTIDEIASSKNKINILCDSPGMGKTVALSKIAQEVIKLYPATTLVRFIILKDFVQVFGQKQINVESVSSLIAEQSSAFEFGRKLVKKSIQSGESILMIDGFDEVLIHQVDKAMKILQVVASLESVRMFVTTRLHLREELESTLQVLGILFEPLNESDQVNFLIQFWKSKGININESVEKFAKSCLKSLSQNVASFESQITGIPLQCRMLAETYIGEAERCSKLGHHVYQNPSSNIVVTSIFEMYQTHMKVSLQQDRCRGGQTVDKGIHTKYDFNTIKSAHMYHALELLFPEDKAQYQHLICPNFPLTINEICRFGILELSDSGSVRFVHHTFAEYLVAWFAVKEKSSKCFNLSNFMLSRIFSSYEGTTRESILIPTQISLLGTNTYYNIKTFRFNFPVVCYFINEFTKSQPILASQLNNISTMLHASVYSQCSGAIIASICHNYPYVMVQINKFLDTNFAIQRENQDFGNLLLLAAKYCDVDLMNAFCDGLELSKIQFSIAIKIHFKMTPLHIAIQRGHYNLVEYLVNRFGSGIADLRFLFHFCVGGSMWDNQATILSKKQIIQFLLTKERQWIEETIDDYNTTPILQNRVHWELLECLIKEGANVNVYDRDQETILHKLTLNNLSPEKFHQLASLLCERKFKHFNLQRDHYEDTPLHLAMKNIELLDDTVRLLYMNGADFNAVDEFKYSVLHYSIRGGRSVHFIRKLIEYGANVRHKTGMLGSNLHVCAEFGNTEALQFFLEVHRMNVNHSNKFGQTPLHVAVETRSKYHECTQHILITRGADVNAPDSSKLNPFLHAFQCSGISLDIIKLMEEYGLKVSQEAYSKALKIATWNTKILLDNNFGNVLTCFIEKGGTFGFAIEKDPCQFKSLMNSMKDAFEATEVTAELLHHAKDLKLITAQESREIEFTKASLKMESFYCIIKGSKGSLEKVVKCLIFSNQLYALSKLREHLKMQLEAEVENILEGKSISKKLNCFIF